MEIPSRIKEVYITKMSVDVHIIRQSRYDADEIEKKIRPIFDGFKMTVRIGKDKKVLLKPNMLSASRPDEHITTHPAIVEAVARILKDRGAKIFLGDSPGAEIVRDFIGYRKALIKTGFMDIIDKYGITPLHFTTSTRFGLKSNHMFKDIEIAEQLKDMDAIVNLPKLKTHVRMYLTLCVKNIFGTVVGKKKVQWHFEAGKNSRIFARILSEIYDTVKPSFHVLDGIDGIEGDGRSSNSIRHMGLIMLGEDGVAIDRIVCEILGADPKKLLTLDACEALGCGKTDLPEINIVGEKIEDVKVKDFKFPTCEIIVDEQSEGFLRQYVKKLVMPKPASDKEKCVLCCGCEDVCPAKAITIKNKKVRIDYRKCINCFCCKEMCDHNAMRLKKSIFYKFIYAQHDLNKR